MTKDELFEQYLQKKKETEELKKRLDDMYYTEKLEQVKKYKGKILRKVQNLEFIKIFIVLDIYSFDMLNVLEIEYNKELKKIYNIRHIIQRIDDEDFYEEMTKEECKNHLNFVFDIINSTL